MTLEFGADREAVRLALEKKNIESRPIWKPMNRQPVFHVEGRKAGNAKEKHKARGVGRGTRMTEEDLDRVTKVISCYKASQIHRLRRYRRSEGPKDIQDIGAAI